MTEDIKKIQTGDIKKIQTGDIKKIQTGDIMMIANGRSWLTRAIVWFQTKSDKEAGRYSHSGIFVWIWGELFVAEAEKHGITLTPFSDYERRAKEGLEILWLRYNTPKLMNLHHLARYIVRFAGKVPYDFINLVIHQPIRILTGKWIGRKCSAADKRFICHEFTAYIQNHIFGNFDKWCEVNAKDIYRAEGYTKRKLIVK